MNMQQAGFQKTGDNATCDVQGYITQTTGISVLFWGFDDARENLKKRGFPSTVLPDNSGYLTGDNFKGDVVERHEILVILFAEEDLFPAGRQVSGRV
jgi:hypothetical protein